MSKPLDTRQIHEVGIDWIKYQPNILHEEMYTVFVHISYILLDDAGEPIGKANRHHHIYPLANPITSLQLINGMDVLAPLVKTAALADRIDICDP